MNSFLANLAFTLVRWYGTNLASEIVFVAIYAVLAFFLAI